jgi:hypothetical protein
MNILRPIFNILVIFSLIVIPAIQSNAMDFVSFEIGQPSAQPQPGSVFNTELKITSFGAAPGAISFDILYDSTVIRMINFIPNPSSEFNNNCFFNMDISNAGKIPVAGFQNISSEEWTTPKLVGTISWQVIGPGGSKTDIKIDPQYVIDYNWNPLEVASTGPHVVISTNDTSPPSLVITSHSNGQHLTTSSVILSGTASDSWKGDNGILQVTVNGVRADNDTATGSGTVNWSKAVTLNAGANTITVIAYDNSANNNSATQMIIIYYDPPDITPPSLNITSHSNGQHVTTASITLIGTASDSGKGDSGVQQVTVNGSRASNDTTSGGGTANWSKTVNLNNGANTITIVAYDNSTNHNTTILSLTIYYDLAQAPSVSTGSATKVTPNSATLNGTVTPNGLSTTYYFEWGKTAAYGNVTSSQSAGSGWSTIAISANLTGLTLNVNYHYRLVATNSLGTTYGSEMTLKTVVNPLPWLELLLDD